MISELKTFIATGLTFKAKSGEQDDLVSALLLTVRLSQVLADWDVRVFDTITTGDAFSDDDWEMPMPIFISSNLG